MSITILTEAEIRCCVALDQEAITAVADAFARLTAGEATLPPILRVDIPEHHGEVDVKTAYVHGLDSFAIKIASGFHENYRLVKYIWKLENLPDDVDARLANFEATSTAAFEKHLEDILAIARGQGISSVLSTFSIMQRRAKLDEVPPWSTLGQRGGRKQCRHTKGHRTQ